jgi:alkyl hydroperoxide reductase subunit AhpF
MGVKISDLTSLSTSTFADDDILEIEQYVSVGVYQTRKMTGAQIREAIKSYALNIVQYTAALTTLQLSDAGKLVQLNRASANDLRLPTNSSVAFPTGTQISIMQYGAGQTTVTTSGGVTLRSSGGKTNLAAQYAMASLIKIGTNEWVLAGDITT